MKNKITILSLAMLASIITIGCGGNSESTEETTVSSIRPVKYEVVGRSQLEGAQTFSGISQALREEELSFRVGGTVTKKLVEVGDLVKKGQLLLVVDPTDYQVDLAQASANEEAQQAQIKSAEAAFISAKSNYDRSQKLYESNSISLSEFENTKANFESAKANYEASIKQEQAASSQTQAASNAVRYTRITAPFSGVISAINIDENETVRSGQKVITLSSIDQIKVEVGVPENAISRIEQNDDVEVHFSIVGDELLPAKVTEVGYSASGSTYPVTVNLLKMDNRIRPDMPADVRFTLEKNASAVIVVPAGSIGEDGSGNFVYKLSAKGGGDELYVANKVPVEVGSISDKGFVVKSGVNNGDYIASAGLNVLRDGIEVRLYDAAE